MAAQNIQSQEIPGASGLASGNLSDMDISFVVNETNPFWDHNDDHDQFYETLSNTRNKVFNSMEDLNCEISQTNENLNVGSNDRMSNNVPPRMSSPNNIHSSQSRNLQFRNPGMGGPLISGNCVYENDDYSPIINNHADSYSVPKVPTRQSNLNPFNNNTYNVRSNEPPVQPLYPPIISAAPPIPPRSLANFQAQNRPRQSSNQIVNLNKAIHNLNLGSVGGGHAHHQNMHMPQHPSMHQRFNSNQIRSQLDYNNIPQPINLNQHYTNSQQPLFPNYCNQNVQQPLFPNYSNQNVQQPLFPNYSNQSVQQSPMVHYVHQGPHLNPGLSVFTGNNLNDFHRYLSYFETFCTQGFGVGSEALWGPVLKKQLNRDIQAVLDSSTDWQTPYHELVNIVKRSLSLLDSRDIERDPLVAFQRVEKKEKEELRVFAAKLLEKFNKAYPQYNPDTSRLLHDRFISSLTKEVKSEVQIYLATLGNDNLTFNKLVKIADNIMARNKNLTLNLNQNVSVNQNQNKFPYKPTFNKPFDPNHLAMVKQNGCNFEQNSKIPNDLNPTYDLFPGSNLSFCADEQVTSYEGQVKLEHREPLNNHQSQALTRTPKSMWKCSFCHAEGHTVEFCWKRKALQQQQPQGIQRVYCSNCGGENHEAQHCRAPPMAISKPGEDPSEYGRGSSNNSRA